MSTFSIFLHIILRLHIFCKKLIFNILNFGEKVQKSRAPFFSYFFFLWYFFCWNEKRKNEKNVKKVLKPEGVAAPHNTAYAVRWHFFCFHFYIWIFYPTEIETFYELIIIVAVIEKKKWYRRSLSTPAKWKKKWKILLCVISVRFLYNEKSFTVRT